MSRTVAFLSLAGGLALLALVLAVPHSAAPSDPPGAAPLPTARPVSTPPPPVAAKSGALSLSGRLSHPLIGVGTSDVFVTAELAGKELPGQERAPVNLALVIDRSGSMEGEKLEHAKEAARHLVRQLRSTDRLAIVHYGSDVRALPSLDATPENQERMLSFINRIVDDGGTNIADGLSAGRFQLRKSMEAFKVNRLILISDGQPTEGITDDRELMRVSRNLHGEGITVSSIGVGTDFNEDLMQGIAEYGAGAYGYLRDSSMLAAIFQKDLQQAGTTVARNVELSFELPEGTELRDVLGYRYTQAGRTVRVPMTDFAAGQRERVVVRLAVRGEKAGASVDVTNLRLRYDDLLEDKPAEAKALLAATVTDRKDEIAQRQDKEVTVIAARARAAENTRRAAQSLAQGERAAAERYLHQNDGIFAEAAAIAGPAPIAKDQAETDALRAGMAEARSEEEVQHQVKSAKAKALKAFGRMGSTY